MYIETIPRKLGGLGQHLMDTGRGSNERVIVRSDLSRDLPTDVTLALRMLAAPARRIRRMKRDVVHIVVSPGRMLSADEQEHVLRTIETEYGIPEGSARLVVEHRKGHRAHHFHIVFSMASEADGKALRFVRSGDRDEMLARRLELELGETLQPSTRVDRTVELLRERGLDDLAERAARGPVAEKGLRQSKAEIRQDARLGADPALIDARLRQAWRQAGGDLSRLRGAVETMGFRLGAGDERIAGVPIVQLIDTETLKMTSLTRHLNRLRVYGDAPRLREVAIGASVGELPSVKEVKAQLRKEAPQRGTEALLREFDHLVAEMESDGERAEAAKARQGRARVAARLSTEEKEDLRTRQGRVRERYRQRDRIRRARVNRVFIAAGVFADPSVRKLAFYLVAAGALATGAGLLAALTIAGVAVASLPSFTSARRARADAAESLAQDRVEQEVELRDTARAFVRERAIALRIADEKRRARERQAHLGAALRRRNQNAAHRQQTELAGLAQQAAKRAADYQRTQVAQRIAARRKPKVPGGGGQAPGKGGPAKQHPRGRDVDR
jgi:hypothetical protein